MIEAESLTKKYPASHNLALDNVSFSARQGEIVGLLGENGAGKSTLLMILSTLLKPTSGRASLCGMDISTAGGLVRSRIGLLLSGQRLYERLTGRENIAYFAGLQGMCRREYGPVISELSGMFGMEDYIDRPVSGYSLGMKQKTSMARMLVHDPDVLMMDEPATGLDLSSLLVFFGFLRKCRERNRTVIFSSHNLHDIERVSDRIIVLHRGRLALEGRIPDLCSAAGMDLENLYLDIIRNRQ
jgi:sodium transport system ATP-binding protein